MTLASLFEPARPLLLLGCGRMGTALARGWLARGLAPEALFVVDPAGRPPLTQGVRHEFVPAMLPDGLDPAAILLAVKPQKVDEVLPALERFAAAGPLLVSIAAGVTLACLTGALPRAVRAMPNSPAAIGRGITVLVPSPSATDADRAMAGALLAAAGEVIWLYEEGLLDPVTAVSGSGPAYVFALAEAMADAGRSEGLPPEIAERLARQTVIGAAALMDATGAPPSALREEVTSPGGTTAAALAHLCGENGLAALIGRAVAEASRRARELGGR